jgi:CheY-like chemotaxis protein
MTDAHIASQGFAYRVLVVDDDPSILELSSRVFKDHGYEVRTAADGFEALIELRRSRPDVIVSDLRMPNMSGFEFLSVVRRRFPHIPVIAVSGEFSGDSPAGLIADAFFTKGQYQPEELFRRIAALIEQAPLRPSLVKPDRAPLWIPLTDTGYFVVTCTDCLRSFSVADEEPDEDVEVRSTVCIFCGTNVCYLADPRTLTLKKKTA